MRLQPSEAKVFSDEMQATELTMALQPVNHETPMETQSNRLKSQEAAEDLQASHISHLEEISRLKGDLYAPQSKLSERRLNEESVKNDDSMVWDFSVDSIKYF
ncbi:uncharacterized protein LOC144095371 [Amblyomma americanum]